MKINNLQLKKQLIASVKPLVERFPKLALACRTFIDGRALAVTPKITPMGFKFNGQQDMELGIFEAEEVDIVKKYLEEVDIFINIGANVGYYSCIALQAGKPVIAFEPIELNLKYLYRNIHINDWGTKAEVFPLALGNYCGVTEMFGGGTGASLVQGWANIANSYKRLVPISTLDRVLQTRLKGKKCFFLVDIEGAERFMLQGADFHLKMDPKPIWLIEISINEHQPNGVKLNPYLKETFEIFWKNGYRARTANKERNEVTKQDIEKIYESGINHLNTHNFLFSA